MRSRNKNILELPKVQQLRLASQSPDIPEIRSFGASSKNEKVKVGRAFLILDGGSLLLDGLYWKRIVFRNTHIVYRGGPVEMQDVYFLNCTFEVRRDAPGQQFARTLLATNPAITKRIGYGTPQQRTIRWDEKVDPRSRMALSYQ